MAYRVLATSGTLDFSLEVKRSRFIGLVKRVDSVEDAEDFISSVRTKYPDAGHVCWAYVLGSTQSVQRSSDDGEPGGTAGVPILQTILKNAGTGLSGDVISSNASDVVQRPLSDIVSVVVRYFGGVKLGAGGLVRAYSEAAAKTLEQGMQCLRTEENIYTIVVPMDRVGKVENQLRQQGNNPLELNYLSSSAEIISPCTSTDFLDQLQLEYSLTDKQWVDTPLV